jgi:hypothetical protein
MKPTNAPADSPVFTSNSQNNQRQSYRYPIPDGNNRGRLYISEVMYPISLLDESAGGFQVIIARGAPIFMGQVIVLQLHSGWFEAEVKRIDDEGEDHKIGLQRLRSIPDPNGDDDESDPRSWIPTYSQVMLVIGVGFAATIGTLLIANPDLVSGWLGGKNSDAAKRAGIAVEYSEKVPDMITSRVITNFNSLIIPKVIESLKLSGDQVRNVETIYRGATVELAVAFERAGGKQNVEWQNRSSQIVQSTMGRLMCVLSDDQLIAWRRMMVAKKPDAE